MVQRKSWTNSQNTKPLVRIYQKYFYLKSYSYPQKFLFVSWLRQIYKGSKDWLNKLKKKKPQPPLFNKLLILVNLFELIQWGDICRNSSKKFICTLWNTKIMIWNFFLVSELNWTNGESSHLIHSFRNVRKIEISNFVEKISMYLKLSNVKQ